MVRPVKIRIIFLGLNIGLSVKVADQSSLEFGVRYFHTDGIFKMTRD